MTNPWDNCLSMGQADDVGQFFDIRGDGFKNKFVTQCDVFDKDQILENYNSDLIDRKHSDDQIPMLLNISKNQLIREMCYQNPCRNDLIEFLFPSAKKYFFICYERLTKIKWIGRYNETIMDATHIISKMDYGSIVWIRIIPDNDEIQIRSIYETYKNGMRINPMHEAGCIIESLTNFTEKQKHNTIKDATEFAEYQMKYSNSCAIRYVLNRLTSNALWQQDDNGTIPALKNLIRIETAKNSISEMLKKMNVKVSKEIQQPLASTLDEKLINNLKNHKFFKFKNLKQPEFLTTVIDMFTLVGRLQFTCYEYMRKRYSRIAMPNRPYIHRVLDMPLIALDFGNDIHKITDENFIQKRHGIFYYNLCTTVQEESFTTQNCCFLLIVDEINLDAILNCFLKWQKLGFLIGFLSGPPKTRFLSKEISNKNEKVFLHINSTFKCFGIALPSKDDIKAALPNSLEFFKGKCRCGNDETRIWICGDCNDFIYLGQGKKAYCKCGKLNFNRMGVKCFNEFHGTEYLYPERDNKFGALSLCLPSSLTSSSKRYLNDKVDECYEAVENQNVLYNNIFPIKNSTSTTPNVEPHKVTTNSSLNESITLSANIKNSDFNGKTIKPVSIAHSYNLRSMKSNNVKENKSDQMNNELTKQRAIVNFDKQAYLGNTETTKSNTTEALKSILEIKPQTLTIQKPEPQVMVPQKQEVRNINIAVIGQSGVGKSTLLNAIANYLKFETAKDAYEKDNLEYIIPCQFKVFYPDFSEKLISIGMPDENEKYEETVLSTTQECKEYSFEFNGYKINFIDTPGLSDTSGIEKDAKNLEKIRTFICTSLDSLHAICFVVKANEARMDLGFSNSMNDLLSIFPKSALTKVIFFMTHSRGTLYGPGDSMTPLKTVSEKLLKKKGITFPLTSENVFCVDNESFLFLCAKNQGIEYSGASFEDFENSWKKSKLATQKFFNKITTLKPLVTVEVQLIKDLENVLQEQKEILNHKHSSCLLIFHYLTAKALELLELGNAANAYLKDIDLGTVKEEAEHCNVKIDHITPSASFLSFINFCLECESGETPVADSFIDKYFSE